jgi:hypothetical protein
MSILKKRNILKLATTFMLMGMMAGAFAMHSSAAFAGSCSATPVAGSTTPGTPNCDVAVNDITFGVTGLSFTSDAAVSSTVAGTFSFAATVTDVRNTNEGWQLQASSPGLTNGTVTHTGYTIPLTIGTTGSSAVCSPTVTQAACPDGSITPIQLTGDPTTFVTETPVNPISGVFALTIDGTYPTTVGTYPGAYTGAITLSLLNTF